MMKKTKLITLGLVATCLPASAATVLLNVGDAGWTPAATTYNSSAASDVTSSTNTINGVGVTASSTGGGLENLIGSWGVGTSTDLGFANAEIDSGDTLTFTFNQAMTFTSVEVDFWDGNNISYTINGTTYTDAGANDAVLSSQTTDSFTTISFSTPSVGNGAFSNITFETAVPEPSSTLLVGLGGLALVARRKRA